MTLSIILGVGITNGGLAVWTLNEILPFALPGLLGQLTFPAIMAIIAPYNALSQTYIYTLFTILTRVYSYENVKLALEKTTQTKVEALCGLLPVLFFYLEVIVVFTTQWAWEYPALALLLLFPSYCLMTCRHIICSVTLMTFNWRQLNPLWFLLFLANKIVIPVLPFLQSMQQKGAVNNDLFPESCVALTVFLITFFLFMKFTVETIGQITSYLGIHCLTIKKKDA